MRHTDRTGFAKALAAVYALYRVELSESVIAIWWQAMQPYDLPAVVDAFGRHTMNPDAGQYLPKPADVVKMLGGSTLDAALVALNKVERAMQDVGAYMTVVFDDPLIHRVVDELGGWPACCQTKLKDWEFRRTEFLNRYRSYRMRSETPSYPAKLIGIADGENGSSGFVVGDKNLRLIGAPSAARAVMLAGSEAHRLPVTLAEGMKFLQEPA